MKKYKTMILLVTFVITVIIVIIYSMFFAQNKLENNKQTNFELTKNPHHFEDKDFKAVKDVLLVNYNEIKSESCGLATQLFLKKINNLNLKYRMIQVFSDPYQGFSTHVAAEVFIPSMNKWIYFDPTFNGYYTDSKSGEFLSAYDLEGE